MVVEKAIDIIKKLDGAVDVQELSKDDRKTLIEIESHHNNDIIPVVNKGLNECLTREFCLVLLKTEDFRIPSEPTVLLVTDSGRILGQELISPEDKKKYAHNDNVVFLSNNFIIFKPDKLSRSMGEKELFILPAIPFQELNDVLTIKDVVSCSPSTLGDKYLKEKYNYPDDPHLATIIVAFSKKEE
ncbi:MAG: hypothetical protein WCF28_05745 [Methanobacterium sp.]|uniref:hypothetical protein n=1 Tax=Methanobacterium sp. TaxID=2164 RepID=UPI003C736963